MLSNDLVKSARKAVKSTPQLLTPPFHPVDFPEGEGSSGGGEEAQEGSLWRTSFPLIEKVFQQGQDRGTWRTCACLTMML